MSVYNGLDLLLCIAFRGGAPQNQYRRFRENIHKRHTLGNRTMESSLNKEFDYYLANQDSLVKLYNGKFVVIKDSRITGAYSTLAIALEEGQKVHDLGTFLVQKVEPGTGAYSQTFHSRVSFAL